MRVTEKNFEDMYSALHAKHSDGARAYYLRDQASEANKMSEDFSSFLLMYIEEIYSRLLWQDKWDHGNKYKTLREWAEHEIGPIYTNGNTETTLAIVVRIVETVFPYVKKQNLQDSKGNPITPKYLIKNVGVSKLKIVSKHYPDNAQTNFRDEIITTMTTDIPATKISQLYSERRITPINSIESFQPDIGTDIFMFGLDEKQLSTIKTALQKLPIRKHSISLSSIQREAILKLLPPLQDNDNSDDIND